MNDGRLGALHEVPASPELLADSIVAVLEPVQALSERLVLACVEERRERLHLRPGDAPSYTAALWFLGERGVIREEDRDGEVWYGLVRDRAASRFIRPLVAVALALCALAAPAGATEGTAIFPLVTIACPSEPVTETIRNEGLTAVCVTGGVINDEGHPGGGWLTIVIRRESDGTLINARSGSVVPWPEQVPAECGTSVTIAPGDAVMFQASCVCPAGRGCSDQVKAWGYVSWTDECRVHAFCRLNPSLCARPR